MCATVVTPVSMRTECCAEMDSSMTRWTPCPCVGSLLVCSAVWSTAGLPKGYTSHLWGISSLPAEKGDSYLISGSIYPPHSLHAVDCDSSTLASKSMLGVPLERKGG
jgi:hypothetical protein